MAFWWVDRYLPGLAVSATWAPLWALALFLMHRSLKGHITRTTDRQTATLTAGRPGTEEEVTMTEVPAHPLSEHPSVQHAVRLRRQLHRERMGAGLIGAVRHADDNALTGLSRVFGWPVTVWLFFALPLIARFLGAAFQSQFFYYSSGWVQLFALPLLTYISVKLQRSSDAQSDVMHQALTHIATVSDQNKQLLDQNTALTLEVHRLVSLTVPPAPANAEPAEEPAP